MKHPRRPTAESPIDLQWAWDVCDAIRERTPLTFQGMRAFLSPMGFSLTAVTGTSQASRAYKRTWDIGALSTSSITIVRCWYLRGGLWKTPATEPTLALSGTDMTVCAAIDTRAGTVTLSSEPDTDSIASGSVYKVPLYVLARPDEDSGWTVACDCRGSMVVLYA